MAEDPDTEGIQALRNVVRRLFYGCVFYYASMKLAPKLVTAVASYWDVEIQANFK